MQPDRSDTHRGHRHGPNRFAVIPTRERIDAHPDFSGRGVTIALIDAGFHPHEDLVLPTNRIRAYVDLATPGRRLVSGAIPEPSAWHGTQTAVVAAGSGHLSDGLYRGPASDASLVLVKVGTGGRITEADIARGLDWVVSHRRRYGIRVVSISLGGDYDVPADESAADLAAEAAIRAGIVVVAAAGNAADRRPIPPANARSVITVGGTDDQNRLAAMLDLYHSSFGPTIDGVLKPEIVAPARWVAAPILPHTEAFRRAAALAELDDTPDYLLPRRFRELAAAAGFPPEEHEHDAAAIRAAVAWRLREDKIVSAHYQHVDGTSFAAPTVAAVVAQMIEARPTLDPAAVREILLSTAQPIAGAAALRQGSGMLAARQAVLAAIQKVR